LVRRVAMKLDKALVVLSQRQREKDHKGYRSPSLVGREMDIDYANEIAVTVLRSGRVGVGSMRMGCWIVLLSTRLEKSLAH
jgi:hypothetical protein